MEPGAIAFTRKQKDQSFDRAIEGPAKPQLVSAVASPSMSAVVWAADKLIRSLQYVSDWRSSASWDFTAAYSQ